jgi:hypothetical protein
MQISLINDARAARASRGVKAGLPGACDSYRGFPRPAIRDDVVGP